MDLLLAERRGHQRVGWMYGRATGFTVFEPLCSILSVVFFVPVQSTNLDVLKPIKKIDSQPEYPPMEAVLTNASVKPAMKRLNLFERYLTIWVGLCMVAGLAVGTAAPEFIQRIRALELGQGSQINLPIAVLIWLMIVPMMMRVDFAALRCVGQRPTGLIVTLFVNWIVKPFSMAFIAWLFFRHVF